MAYNTTNHVYYLKQYSEIKEELTEQQLASFLQDVLEGRAKVQLVETRVESQWKLSHEETYKSDKNRVVDFITYAKMQGHYTCF